MKEGAGKERKGMEGEMRKVSVGEGEQGKSYRRIERGVKIVWNFFRRRKKGLM